MQTLNKLHPCYVKLKELTKQQVINITIIFYFIEKINTIQSYYSQLLRVGPVERNRHCGLLLFFLSLTAELHHQRFPEAAVPMEQPQGAPSTLSVYGRKQTHGWR